MKLKTNYILLLTAIVILQRESYSYICNSVSYIYMNLDPEWKIYSVDDSEKF